MPPRPATPAVSDALHALRCGTREAHAQVEALADAPARMRDRGAYRDWLARMLGVHATLDPALEAAFPALAPSGRVDRLCRDLRALGASDVEDLARLAPGDLVGPGTLYVVEGSALGGAVLGRQARASLRLTALDGAAFLGGAGPVGPRWRAVCAQLAALRLDGPALDAAVAEARATFVTIGAWLCR